MCARFCGSHEALRTPRSKPRQTSVIFIKKTCCSRNLVTDQALASMPPTPQRAERQLPIICSIYDIVFIRLHDEGAGTISDSVTSRERVARTMSSGAAAPGDGMMNTSLNHGSAKIYQFPAGGRSALGGRRYEDARPSVDLASLRVGETGGGSGWYHEAAIAVSKPVREC